VLGCGGGQYQQQQSGCTAPPPAGKFAYVAYSPVTAAHNADVTCSDVITCPAGCSCVSAADGGDMTSALPTSGLTSLGVGDRHRHSVDFV